MAKKLTGIVVSTKMKNVAVVEVAKTYIHPKYKKQIKKTKRLKARIIKEVHVGDKVIIRATRPTSKETAWEIIPDKIKDKNDTA